MRARIAGTGSYLPERRVDSDEVAALAGLELTAVASVAWRAGCRARHFAEPWETTSDLALEASVEAVRAAGLRPGDVDCIVLATQSGDRRVPGAGVVLGAKLGLAGMPVLEMQHESAGFLHALSVADHFVRLGTYGRVLVVAADVMSSMVEFSRRGGDAAIAYGDGAGAVVLVPGDGDAGLLASGLHADGRFASVAAVPMPGSLVHRPLETGDLDAGAHLPVLGGPDLLQEGYRRVRQAIDEALAACALAPSDVAHVLANQSMAGVTRQVCRRLAMLPAYRPLPGDLADTASASLPMTLDAVVRAGDVRPGDLMLLTAFGAGFSWGWAVLRW
jgi:3-oxoacyl-[acyl-carrier-protein] synthase III